MEQGVKKGRMEGRMEGLNEGKRQLILNMLTYGLDAEVISASTGLSKDEILRMKE